MPSFISREGVWEPAKERAVNPNAPAGQEIYEGPDREAVKMLNESGGSMGQHYSLDPEMIMRARQLGFKDVDEYLKMYNYNKEKAIAAYEKAKASIVTHADTKKQVPVVVASGGQDTSGQGANRSGGFGRPEELGGGKE
jgi:hypothetical protein